MKIQNIMLMLLNMKRIQTQVVVRLTESNLVEFDEDSTKGIVTGAVSDHTTVEDTKEYTTESNLIELVDELPEEHGQAQGQSKRLLKITSIFLILD